MGRPHELCGGLEGQPRGSDSTRGGIEQPEEGTPSELQL